jgi:hypothetical protein
VVIYQVVCHLPRRELHAVQMNCRPRPGVDRLPGKTMYVDPPPQQPLMWIYWGSSRHCRPPSSRAQVCLMGGSPQGSGPPHSHPYGLLTMMMLIDDPVWPTCWAVGALFRGVRRIHINHVCFHVPPRRHLVIWPPGAGVKTPTQPFILTFRGSSHRPQPKRCL